MANTQNEMVQTETKEMEKELTLSNWTELTEEQQTSLKESLIKSTYGIGGEHFSTFPTLLDNKINTWVETEYKISKLPKRVSESTFKEWKTNGEIKILPVEKDNKIYYLTILLPNKNTKIDVWELQKEDKKPYLEYTSHNKIQQLQFGKTHFHILNGYTNKNKAYNQAKALVKLFNLGTDFQTLEQQKELQHNYLKLDITNGTWELKEISKNTHKPTGNTYKGIGESLGKAQHKSITTNYMELLQTV